MALAEIDLGKDGDEEIDGRKDSVDQQVGREFDAPCNAECDGGEKKGEHDGRPLQGDDRREVRLPTFIEGDVTEEISRVAEIEVIGDAAHAFDVFTGGDVSGQIEMLVCVAGCSFRAIRRSDGDETVFHFDLGHVEEVSAPDEEESDRDHRDCLAPIPVLRIPRDRCGFENQDEAERESKHRG